MIKIENKLVNLGFDYISLQEMNLFDIYCHFLLDIKKVLLEYKQYDDYKKKNKIKA